MVLPDCPSNEWSRQLAPLCTGQPPGVNDDLTDASWDRELDELFLRIGYRFGGADLRRRMRDYILGLLGPVGRMNGWQLAEFVGHRTPGGFQRLLNRAVWNADHVRDDLQAYVPEQLGDSGGV